MPVRDYQSVAQYVYEALMLRKYRMEIVNTLMDNGYNRQQANNIYHMYRQRFFEFRQRLDEARGG